MPTKSLTHRDGPLLPLSHSISSPSSSRTYRSSRRLSYGLKQRINRHRLPISLSALLALTFFVYTYSSSSALSSLSTYSSQLTSHAKNQLYARESRAQAREAERQRNNGLTLLTEDVDMEELIGEDELLSEEALYVQGYKEPTPKTASEQETEERFQNHRADVLEQDRVHSLEALIWWLAEGGVFPNSYGIPNKAGLTKMGGSGFERALDRLDAGGNGESIFQDGWADYAKKQYRLVVFSKTYCPYSKKAKKILEEYRLTPAPFIVELDQRSDTTQLQSLLLHLTGRRTVPNILLDFQSIGGSDEVALLHGEGGLKKMFQEAEMLPGFKRRFTPVPAPRLELPEIPVYAPNVIPDSGERPPADARQVAPVADFGFSPADGYIPPAQEQLQVPIVVEGDFDHGFDPAAWLPISDDAPQSEVDYTNLDRMSADEPLSPEANELVKLRLRLAELEQSAAVTTNGDEAVSPNLPPAVIDPPAPPAPIRDGTAPEMPIPLGQGVVETPAQLEATVEEPVVKVVAAEEPVPQAPTIPKEGAVLAALGNGARRGARGRVVG